MHSGAGQASVSIQTMEIPNQRVSSFAPFGGGQPVNGGNSGAPPLSPRTRLGDAVEGGQWWAASGQAGQFSVQSGQQSGQSGGRAAGRALLNHAFQPPAMNDRKNDRKSDRSSNKSRRTVGTRRWPTQQQQHQQQHQQHQQQQPSAAAASTSRWFRPD